MNKTKKTILAFLACVILVSISLYDNWKYRDRKKTGEQTVGLIESGLKNISWTYTVNGQTFTRRLSKSHYYFMEDGEKYMIYYDKNDPEQSSLSATEPVFDTTKFIRTSSLPIELEFEKGSHEVTFQFLVKNDTITRINRILFDSDITEKVNSYQVYYNADKPIISYIRLKKIRTHNTVYSK